MTKPILSPRLLRALEILEGRTGMPAYDLLHNMDKLKQWQDGDFKDSYFMEYLNRQIDKIAETE